MTGASIETTLEFWASSLRDVKARLRRLGAVKANGPSGRAAVDWRHKPSTEAEV